MKNDVFRLAVLCFCLLAIRTAATTYYVDVNSPNSTPPYTSWSTAATNIQDAVNQTSNGDLVLVNPGAYGSTGYTAPDGSLTAIVVTNAVSIQGLTGQAVTWINGSNAMRCAYLADGAALGGFTLTNGSAGSAAGVLCATTNALISNCLIIGNNTGTYGYGGGAYLGTLSNCTITANSAEFGGALYSSAAISCILSSNSASFYGGGAYRSALTNCLIVGNTAGAYGYGGGVNTCIINNCTVVNNYAGVDDGGIDQPSSAYNCIIYYNTSGGSDQNFQPGATINYCCTTPIPPVGGNITNAPLFVNIANDFELQSNSLCINAGNNANVTLATDLAGGPRIVDGVVDMGAYEYQAPVPLSVTIQVDNTKVVTGYPFQLQAIVQQGIAGFNFWNFGDGSTATNQLSVSHVWTSPGVYIVTLLVSNAFAPESSSATLMVNVAAPAVYYVNANGNNPVAPYNSWNTAATNIQNAVDVAYDGGTVLVTNGVYQFGGETVGGFALTNRVLINKSILVQSVNGPAVTVIQGNPNAGTNAIRCVYLAASSVLVGFTLTEGATLNFGDQTNEQSGGGVFCQSTNQEIISCVVSNNSSVHSAGGIYQGSLNNCLVANNFGTSTGLGGGACSSIITNCTITGNEGGYGGGLYGCTVANSTVTGNLGIFEGGGANASTLVSCGITGNDAFGVGDANGAGGGAYDCTLNNCTVRSNDGAGAYSCMMTNCIISGNYTGANGGGGGPEHTRGLPGHRQLFWRKRRRGRRQHNFQFSVNH